MSRERRRQIELRRALESHPWLLVHALKRYRVRKAAEAAAAKFGRRKRALALRRAKRSQWRTLKLLHG
jgi:hypothetical protein